MKPQWLTLQTRLIMLLIGTGLFVIVLFRNAPTSHMAQSGDERDIVNKIPPHVPIKVKIKPEKEKALKDLKNEKWIRDFEIEVTNTSDKPIYFLNLWVVLPEIISYENGYPVGFSLRYGRGDFIHFKTIARADDVPLRPGETFTLSIPQKYQKGWEWHKTAENRPNPKKIEISFTQLSFGDGSGFNGTDAKPYPYERSESKAGPCREGPGNSDNLLAFALERPVANSTKTFSFSFTPVAPLPVKFFHRKLIIPQFRQRSRFAARAHHVGITKTPRINACATVRLKRSRRRHVPFAPRTLGLGCLSRPLAINRRLKKLPNWIPAKPRALLNAQQDSFHTVDAIQGNKLLT